MNLSQLRSRVSDKLEATNWADITSSVINNWINEAQRWVCRGVVFVGEKQIQHNFSFLETELEADTVDGQRRYDLPAATGSVRAFKQEINVELIDSSSYRKTLIKLDKKEIEDRKKFQDTTAKGTPSHYCIQQNDIWLFPLPDHSINNDTAFKINLDYYGWLTDLSADDDTNVLLTDNYEVVEFKAIALGMEWQKDALASYFNQKADQALYELVLDDIAKTSGEERGMRPDTGQGIGVGGTRYVRI